MTKKPSKKYTNYTGVLVDVLEEIQQNQNRECLLFGQGDIALNNGMFYDLFFHFGNKSNVKRYQEEAPSMLIAPVLKKRKTLQEDLESIVALHMLKPYGRYFINNFPPKLYSVLGKNDIPVQSGFYKIKKEIYFKQHPEMGENIIEMRKLIDEIR